jgi:hypothetical protein
MVVGHARYVAFQVTEVTKNLRAEILRMIAELLPPSVASMVDGSKT